MTRSLSRWQALVLGLVVLLGGAGTVAALFAVGGRYWPWDNSFRIRAGFDKVHGVEPGTRVRVQGIDAGEVEEVLLPTTPGGNVTLVLRLKPAVRELIRSDAAAQIVSEGMIGGKVLDARPERGLGGEVAIARGKAREGLQHRADRQVAQLLPVDGRRDHADRPLDIGERKLACRRARIGQPAREHDVHVALDGGELRKDFPAGAGVPGALVQPAHGLDAAAGLPQGPCSGASDSSA